MKDTKQEILHFWFEETSPSQWFQKSDAFDQEITQRFLGDYTLGKDGVYDGWQTDGEGSLALCILLDQFPRHMFRGSPKAYETDAKALVISKHAVAKGYDKMLEALQRRFLYLPFEHSERLNDQARAVELFEEIRDEDPIGYDYAVRHYDIIERFGRFPHRNPSLGRETTPEEAEFLKTHEGF